MDPIYRELRSQARRLLKEYPPPDFYLDHADSVVQSRRFFDGDPVVTELRDLVAGRIENDFGHGLEHAVKVALDAGALMFVEAGAAGYARSVTLRRVRLAQSAGLLHDIVRKAESHAVHSAAVARRVLSTFRLAKAEIEDVCLAIRNHEAFQEPVPIDTPEGKLLSGVLYDADKFRWGPDNFEFTVWDMAAYHGIPLPVFLQRYPQGMRRLADIRDTFRTNTGRRYGPQFIDIGLTVGQRLLDVIKADYADRIH